MSTFSPSLRIELITTGDQAGVWGNTTNTNLGTLVESAIAGYVSVSITAADQALTAVNGAADQSRNQVIALTTTTVAAFNVYAPPAEKTYTVYNASAYAATLYNSTVLGNTTAAGVGATIPAGKTVTLWSDGTNFVFQNNHLTSLTLVTDLAIADGGTGASTAADARTNLGVTATGADTTYAFRANNLSDLASATTARTNLGLGTIATQNSSSVSITGGSITGITDLAVADGGTGASDAATARTNLAVPSATGSGASGTWGINITGNAATATTASTTSGNAATASNPASGGTFITSLNIGSQTVAVAGTTTGNAATASNPASGGSFITSSNIGSQSVAFATNATNATNATTSTTQAPGTNTTAIATTAFSAAAITAERTAAVTLTNKTVNLTSNTLTGTQAQFNTACSDTDFSFLSDFIGSNQSLSANGYQKLPGGLVVQWGTFVPTSSTTSLTFNIAFATACVTVLVMDRYNGDTGGGSQITALNAAPSTTGAVFSSATTVSLAYWLALGY